MMISILLLLLPFFLFPSTHALTESLTLRPLEDGKVVAVVSIEMKISHDNINAGHYYLFPRSLGSLLTYYDVDELSLKLTAGRWYREAWGEADVGDVRDENGTPIIIPSPSLGPIGAELWTYLNTSHTSDMSTRWKGLTHHLAGIYCTTLNAMDDTTLVYPKQGQKGNDTLYHYATLPRENVCTENLTPWLKLLPCRHDAGMGMLLDGKRLYHGWYHTLRVHVIRTSHGYTLTQSITTVLDPYMINHQKHWNWNIQTLFGLSSPLLPCPIASSSHIYLHLPFWYQHQYLSHITLPQAEHIYQTKDGGKIYVYPPSTSLEFTYNTPFIIPTHYQSTPYLLFQRYNTGSGQQHATYNMEWYNSHPTDAIRIRFQDSLPWFLHVYFHALKIEMNEVKINLKKDVHWYHFIPATYRSTPTEIELEISLPPQSTTRLSFSFDKSFLTTNDYPPDVSRGFDLASALITIIPKDGSTPIQVYTNPSLVLLPFPDFSMPFNVIAFTSTVLAFFFGSMFNMLYSSPNEILTRNSKRPINRLTNRLFRRCRTTEENKID